ncbi:MAG: hypothetical protein HYY84_11255 [Deltaproteobacteria bacterium]|nr:hypothetical protein [Deltaproteobacteria bacterium]
MMRLVAGLGFAFTCIMFGCVPNRLSLIFKGSIKPDSACTYAAGGSSFLTAGLIDLFYTSEYKFGAEIKNQLSGSDSASVVISTIRWKLSIAKPLSTFLACGKILARTSAGNEPCTNATNATYQKYFEVGLADQLTNLLTAGSSAALVFNFMNAEVSNYILTVLSTGATGEPPYFTTTDSFITALVEIEIIGKSLGEVEVTTGPFIYPIEICYGCLRSQPNGASCSSGTSDTGAALLTKPCSIGQDALIDCRYACGRNGDCKTNETCSTGSCFCGSNAGCTNSNSCSGTACNCGGGAACTGSQTCTAGVCVSSS